VLLRHIGQQFADPARFRQGDMTEMVFQVEFIVLRPEHALQVLVEGAHRRGHLPHLVGDFMDKRVGVRVFGNVEQHQAAHVHGLLPTFQPEEKLVDGTECAHENLPVSMILL